MSAGFKTIFGVISAVVGYVALFINALADLISGNITFGQFMDQIWNGFKAMLFNIFVSITTGIGAFVLGLIQKGIAAGVDLLSCLNWFYPIITNENCFLA